jgi:adenylosuccinate lyase
MSICPIEWRYGSYEMKSLFSRENIFNVMKEVEVALLEALEEIGIAEDGLSSSLRELKISPEEVDRIEREIGHDVMALVSVLYERTRGRFIHFGATSNDIIDTAWAIILREAIKVVKEKLRNLIIELGKKAIAYKDVLQVGRTHGQHAIPITFGFKLANYVYELTRSYERLNELEKRVIRGKISGAVGTMASWGKMGFEIERRVLSRLKLEPHMISTQVAPRDGYAELISNLAILGSSLDRLAIEIRELMRPEIDEVAESREGKIGSSTMPQKENPVDCEKVSSLARLLRGLVVTSLENIPLWHERDLTNSASERIEIPHSFIIIDEMLSTMMDVVRKLIVKEGNMRRNIDLSKGLIMSEALMIELTRRKMDRQEAHKLVRELVKRSKEEGKALIDVVRNDERVSSIIDKEEIENLMKPENYLGLSTSLIYRAINYAESTLNTKIS